jgi:hypothetical protein
MAHLIVLTHTITDKKPTIPADIRFFLALLQNPADQSCQCHSPMNRLSHWQREVGLQEVVPLLEIGSGRMTPLGSWVGLAQVAG